MVRWQGWVLGCLWLGCGSVVSTGPGEPLTPDDPPAAPGGNVAPTPGGNDDVPLQEPPEEVPPENPAEPSQPKPQPDGGMPQGPSNPPPKPDAGTPPPTGALQWAHQYGVVGSDDMGIDVAVSPVGNVFLASRFSNGTDFGGGPIAVQGQGGALTKLSPVGKHVWTRAVVSEHVVQPFSVAVDSNGSAAMVGNFTGPTDFGQGLTERGGLFIVKYRWDGEPLWTRTIIGTDASHWGTLVAAEFDLAGNLYVAGDFHGEGFDFGDGVPRSSGGAEHLATLVAKYGPNGNVVWVRALVAEGASLAKSVAVSPSGQVAITFNFSGQFDLGNGQVLTGAPASSAAPTPGIAVFDTQGNARWAKTWFGDFVGLAFSETRLAAVGMVADGFNFAGKVFTPQERDGVLAVFDANGVEQWAQLYTGAGLQQLSAVAIAGNGDLYVSGQQFSGAATFAGRTSSARGQIVARLSPQGSARWLHSRQPDTAYSGGISLGVDGSVASCNSFFVKRSCNDEGSCQVDNEIEVFRLSP